ncbi:MAG TPA: FISUMP domain-containing protein [Bacteroidales bacterium]|nr:FISUMP domain-containing protein [Bacteroidales bacterium]HQB21955.1 FISUMP domain-containing protein [Bacteroidales bacterium]
MKKIISISLLAFFGLSLNIAFAQNDTLYIMKNGNIIGKYIVADVDSIIFYQPAAEEISGSFVDSRDNKLYTWIKIGSQIWMAENLAYVPTDGSNYWASGCNVSNVEDYGYLYDWSAVMNEEGSSESNPSEVQGICPDGWHLPSKAEWEQLINYLGGEDVAGAKLKETGPEHWGDGNVASNESGFTARGGGLYAPSITDCFDFENYGFWWSATEYETNRAWSLMLNRTEITAPIYDDNKNSGYSVRCVKN